MKSPFPGMDPFLERHWRDVHASLIIYARDRLHEQLPGGLRCRVEERVVLELPEGQSRSMYPDVRVIEKPHATQGGVATLDAAVAVAEPVVVDLADEGMTETFLEIIDASSGNRVVTVIEVLSPTNKLTAEGRAQFEQKRKELRDGGVSFVEIDLLRQGERLFPFPRYYLKSSLPADYHVFIRRGWRPSRFEVYPISLKAPLPTIKIPLRETDADILLELQPLIEKCYRNGGYEDLDYRQPLQPPLEGADAEWMEQLLQAAGKP